MLTDYAVRVTGELILDLNLPYGEVIGHFFNCKIYDDDNAFHVSFNGQYAATIESNKYGMLNQTNGVPIPDEFLTVIVTKIESYYG